MNISIYIYKLNDKTFKILLYFDFLQFFYGLSMKPKSVKSIYN